MLSQTFTWSMAFIQHAGVTHNTSPATFLELKPRQLHGYILGHHFVTDNALCDGALFFDNVGFILTPPKIRCQVVAYICLFTRIFRKIRSTVIDS